MCHVHQQLVENKQLPKNANANLLDKEPRGGGGGDVIVEKYLPTIQDHVTKCENPNLVNKLLTKNVKSLEKEYKECLIEKSVPRTSDLYRTQNIPQRFECPYLFKGYGTQSGYKNPFYKTVNSEYGYYCPNPHTVPTKFFPREQKFSVQLAKAGLYRNCSLNTQPDHIQFSTKVSNSNTCKK